MSIEPTTPPPTAARDPALDGLRGLACLMVYFYHEGIDLRRPPLVVLGFTGVHIFFVLSGYLMFSPLLDGLLGGRWPSTWRYAVRRFTRIYPPFAVSLALFAAARYLARLKPPGAPEILNHALMYFNFLDGSHFFTINVVFWSLAVEAQFYVLLPLSAWLAGRLVGRGWAAAWGVVAGFFLVGTASRAAEFLALVGRTLPESHPRFTTVFAFLDLFAAGMAVACVERAAGPRLRPMRWAFLGLGAVVAVAAGNWSVAVARSDWFTGPDLSYTVGFPVLLCLGYGLAFLGVCLRPPGSPGALTWRPLVRVGQISYSIYLYHVGVQVALGYLLGPVFPRLDWWGHLGIALIKLPPTLLVSAVMYRLIERPSMRLGARYSMHRAPRSEGPTAGTAPADVTLEPRAVGG